MHFFIFCISVGAFQKRAKTYIVLNDLGESPFATAHVFRAVPCRVTRSNIVLKVPFKDNSNLVQRGHYHGALVKQDWKLCLFVLAQSEELKGSLALSCCRKLKAEVCHEQERRKLVIVNDNRGHN